MAPGINHTGIATYREGISGRGIVLSRPHDNHPPSALRLVFGRRGDVRNARSAELSAALPHLGQDGEHALAFILIGLAFGLAYARHRLLTTAVAVLSIGLLEIMQLWAPGRHARFEDFAVDALTACAGLAFAAGLDWATQRLRLNQSAS